MNSDEIKEKIELIDGFFNKGWACDLDEVYSAVIDTITNLQQENERLKEWKKNLLSENIELEGIRKDVIKKVKDLYSYLQGGDKKWHVVKEKAEVKEDDYNKSRLPR